MKINYHGGGYVGLTGASHYANAGHDVTISDPDATVVAAINVGQPKAGIFLVYLEGVPCIRASVAVNHDADAHIIAVPSEKNGEPFMAIVESVFSQLCASTPPLTPIIVESTVMPGMAARLRYLAQTITKGDRPWAIAPRRDWFADKDKNLHTLTRIVGRDVHAHRAIEPIITAVCRDIHWTTPETAEITKALENALLHLPVVLLHELALLFPEYDIVEAAELASTHWRFKSMGKLYLGFGTGGRCVPLGSKYLSERGGALLGDALEIDDQFASIALDEALQASNPTSELGAILVLGVAYRPGFKDAGNSPGLRIALALDRFSPDVFDPYFTRDEIIAMRARSGAKTSATIENIAGCAYPYDTVVLTVAHPEFADLWKRLRPHATVLDATGMWEQHLTGAGRTDVNYIRPGRPNWIPRERSHL